MFDYPDTIHIYNSLCKGGWDFYAHQFFEYQEEDWHDRLGTDYHKISRDWLFIDHMITCINTDLQMASNFAAAIAKNGEPVKSTAGAEKAVKKLTDELSAYRDSIPKMI